MAGCHDVLLDASLRALFTRNVPHQGFYNLSGTSFTPPRLASPRLLPPLQASTKAAPAACL
eukprot:scaffold4161_cov218-Pinguiococcus_pyrenoidosus.AAC.5